MTSPTTIKLTAALRERITPLAEAAGKTAHAWMVEALERQAAMAEARESFLADAEVSAAELDAGGALYAAEDVAAYLLARSTGKRLPKRPRPIARVTAKVAGKTRAVPRR